LGLWVGVLLAAACGPAGPSPQQVARQNARALYLDNCAPCHGEAADGRGPNHQNLDPRPRDYTDPVWLASATEESVFQAITHGVAGSAMPAWDMLSEQERRDLATYVLSVAEMGANVAGAPAPE
jgi:high-affinity iron transporter